MEWIGGYLLAVNLCGWLFMRMDKRRARRQAWRIKEQTLFLIALLGGALGCLIGMYMFRHKTRHARFVWGMPLILAIQIALIMFYGGRLFL
ncbi:DUF1294 domain-containing protein [Aneurinibacillus sp. REN35]|uniref:DUF1294 domain-containing protein n=1 Tax=Aneurinibacillus sp. REN35 TaxID=3237286 RepID=UPI003528F533